MGIEPDAFAVGIQSAQTLLLAETRVSPCTHESRRRETRTYSYIGDFFLAARPTVWGTWNCRGWNTMIWISVNL